MVLMWLTKDAGGVVKFGAGGGDVTKEDVLI